VMNFRSSQPSAGGAGDISPARQGWVARRRIPERRRRNTLLVWGNPIADLFRVETCSLVMNFRSSQPSAGGAGDISPARQGWVARRRIPERRRRDTSSPAINSRCHFELAPRHPSQIRTLSNYLLTITIYMLIYAMNEATGRRLSLPSFSVASPFPGGSASSATPFRINTCRYLSKHATSSPLKSTLAQKRGGGPPALLAKLSLPSFAFFFTLLHSFSDKSNYFYSYRKYRGWGYPDNSRQDFLWRHVRPAGISFPAIRWGILMLHRIYA
jgi:hypothetical protein